MLERSALLPRPAAQEFLSEQDRGNSLHLIYFSRENFVDGGVERQKIGGFDLSVQGGVRVSVKVLAQHDVRPGVEAAGHGMKLGDVRDAMSDKTRFFEKLAFRCRARIFAGVDKSAGEGPVTAVGALSILPHEEKLIRCIEGNGKSECGLLEDNMDFIPVAARNLIGLTENGAPWIFVNLFGVDEFPLAGHRCTFPFPACEPLGNPQYIHL